MPVLKKIEEAEAQVASSIRAAGQNGLAFALLPQNNHGEVLRAGGGWLDHEPIENPGRTHGFWWTGRVS